MLIFYDLRINRLVVTAGLEAELDAIELKRGGEQALAIQFGTSPATATSQSVLSDPQWTVEQLPGTVEIRVGIKAAGVYEGEFLTWTDAATWDPALQVYDLDLPMVTQAIDDLLMHDGVEGNDLPAIYGANFEVKYRNSGADPWRLSINPVDCTIYHNVLDGDETTPI